jgi:hypothetical protein
MTKVVTTMFNPAPGVAITISIIADGEKVVTRIFTSTGSNDYTDLLSYTIDPQEDYQEDSQEDYQEDSPNGVSYWDTTEDSTEDSSQE